MNVTCVTTMNKPIYDSYGSEMINSWAARWFDDAKLIVYTEGFCCTSLNNITYKSWNDNCADDWLKYCKQTGTTERSQKFAKKGFAFHNAMKAYKKSQSDLLIWIDADIFFRKKITKQIIIDLIPDTKLLAAFDFFYKNNPDYTQEQYLDLQNRRYLSAESGFAILNTNHYLYESYVTNYYDCFITDKKHEKLSNWYDGEVLMVAAADFLSEVEDLSKHRTTNKTQTPMNKSFLNQYMTHQKGGVKRNLSKEDIERFTNGC